ncbi:MAG: adenosylcobinamide-phosphate synthase CbiB [Novosphingobium sp.]
MMLVAALDRPEQLCLALVAEAALGYPAWLYRTIGHPVSWSGRAIRLVENLLNRGSAARQRLGGGLCAVLLIAAGGGVGWLAEAVLAFRYGPLIIALLATTGLAQRSLWQHVRAVARPLKEGPLANGDLNTARTALCHVVGRDTAALDEAGISAAAIETLAESFCDGVVAPAFWFLLGGLPGLFAFKAVSTADSMIGHIDVRNRYFGTAAARLDDVMNWLPARIAALLILLAARGRGWRVLWRDHAAHASPNAGWPESAMAGALGVRLGGGAFYDAEWLARPALGDGESPASHNLDCALRIYLRACILLWLIAGGIAWLR